MAGVYFDELHVGQLFTHALHRTITEADNVFFSCMTHNPALLHLDEEYCANHTEFGRRVVNSCFTLGLMVGISVSDTTLGTAIANLGWDEVRFPKPLFHGDTIRIETEVAELRESRSRPNAGIVTFIHRAYNQHDVLVAHCRRSGLQLKRPAPASQVESAPAPAIRSNVLPQPSGSSLPIAGSATRSASPPRTEDGGSGGAGTAPPAFS